MEQKFISDCRYRVIESSSLVPVLFREVFSHPYISLFHLLVNGFSVIYVRLFLNTHARMTYVCPCAHECFANEIQDLRNGRLSSRSDKSTSRSSL